MVRVVVPVAGHCPDLISRCLKHLFRYGVKDMKAIVVSNAASPATVDEARKHPVNLVRFRDNLGFTKAVNCYHADGDHLMILNSDCFIGPGVVEKLLKSMGDGWGAICPLTGDRGGASLRRQSNRIDAGVTRRIRRRWHRPDLVSRLLQRDAVVSRPEIPFFCAMLNADAIRDVGLLDESYSDGLMADNLWCWKASAAGWQVGIHVGCYAHHLHGETFRRLGMSRTSMKNSAVAKAVENGNAEMRGRRACPR